MSIEIFNLKRQFAKAKKKEIVRYNIIPQLEPYNEVRCYAGDTLVFHLDGELWDLDAAQQWYNVLSKAFPNQPLVVTLGNNRVEVIKGL